MSTFLTPLDMRYVEPWHYWNNDGWHDNDGTDRLQLLAVFRYYSDLLGRVVEAPEGFRFDRASVPTWPILFARYGGRYTRSACVHDALCRQGHVDRLRCDLVFLEACRHENSLEIAAMREAGIDADTVADRARALDQRALEMFIGVRAYSVSKLWQKAHHRPGFEPVV